MLCIGEYLLHLLPGRKTALEGFVHSFVVWCIQRVVVCVEERYVVIEAVVLLVRVDVCIKLVGEHGKLLLLVGRDTDAGKDRAQVGWHTQIHELAELAVIAQAAEYAGLWSLNHVVDHEGATIAVVGSSFLDF